MKTVSEKEMIKMISSKANITEKQAEDVYKSFIREMGKLTEKQISDTFTYEIHRLENRQKDLESLVQETYDLLKSEDPHKLISQNYLTVEELQDMLRRVLDFISYCKFEFDENI